MTYQRKEIIGDATLYLGDCRAVMSSLVPVDAVITDPPYSERTHKKAKTNRGGDLGGSELVSFASLSDEQFVATVTSCLDVADGWVVMTCDYRHAALMYQHSLFVRLGAWVKPNPMPQITGDRPGQGFETVLIMHAAKKTKTWSRGGGSGVWTVPVTSGAEVPTQKPLPLIAAFVSDFTKAGETVLDPFLGSGTTGVACVKLGRRFVGCEALPEHFDIACRRIEEAYKQPRLFDEPAPKPIQASLLEGLA